ncbi:helix-turn-helix domain-containing protein [Burkholderia cepacia]|uniref:helix-turn-helix domain-containing protein n=1 Tax=Burkholderia cepacia TaxID=292 RepID=UPI001CF1CD53|nr:helix-turn-helix transcriptional regulator [Burkholderia cepacia]MCA8059442.1 helix-turn-helix domain-containing protein [Burkholderia cepacia]
MTHADPDWLAMLREAVAATTQTEVARQLGRSKSTVSLVLSGKYPGKTDRVAARVLKTFGQVQCTHTGQQISLTVCVSFANRRAPLNNPMELSHWRTCRNCPLRPVKGGSK